MLKTIKRWLSYHGNRQIGTYMNRWYVIPPQWGLPISVRLQHIRRADGERLHHNHPYAFKSIVLKGWYEEEQVRDFPPLEAGCEYMAFDIQTVMHRKFKLFTIAQKRYHRLVSMSKGGVWTLIWHPRKAVESDWGYLNVDGSHIPHDEYVRPAGYDLPYKANAYRRNGPASPGVSAAELDGSRVIDTSDTQELLDQIKTAAQQNAIYNPKAVQKGNLPK